MSYAIKGGANRYKASHSRHNREYDLRDLFYVEQLSAEVDKEN